jgi:putative acetyltransferase
LPLTFLRGVGLPDNLIEYLPSLLGRRSSTSHASSATPELQPAAIALYPHAGYQLVREVVTETASNKTIGGGIRGYHFEKQL